MVANNVNNPLVSIITLNWNGLEETLEFLESSRHLTYPNFEILVCDMNSKVDPTIEISRRNFPNTKVFRSDTNLGFAAGNNWGMQHAKGTYYFIVNNDTILTSDIIEQLLNSFSFDIRIGFVSPKIKYYHNPEIIQFAGFTKLNLYTARNRAIGRNETDMGQYETPGFTNLAHGCAMMVRKNIAEEIGKFPREFFLYYEEVDWSLRLIKAGFKIYFQPKAVIFHKESMSVGKDTPLKVYYLTRNRILLIRRHANAIQKIVFYLYFFLFAFPAGIFRYSGISKSGHLKAFLKGILWNFTHKSDCVTE